jgi:hypothetical protein
MTQTNATARASRRADGHFTTIANAALRDPRLSWKAKGVLAGALSHGPGFRFNREWFIRNSTDGESAIRSAFVELRDHGYLANERVAGDDGRFVSGGLHFTDDPAMHEETHQGENLLVENPPGGEPPTIRRSIERTPTEEDHVDTLYPASGENTDRLTPRERGTNPRAQGTNPRALGTNPRALGTNPRAVELAIANAREPFRAGKVAADPQPQQQDPAPSPKPRMAKPRAFEPTTDDIPASLLPAEAPLRAFWEVKGGQRTQQAWNCLTGALERIWRHPDGGMEAVREQLDGGIQNGWGSITFANWQKYGTRPAGFLAAGGRRKSSTEEAADAVIAFYNSMETA